MLRPGNAVILKQSSNTPLCANRFADAFKEAGLPDGVFQVRFCPGQATLVRVRVHWLT